MSQDNPNEPVPGESQDLGETLSSESETAYFTPEEKKPQTTTYVVLAALLVIGPAVLFFMYNRKGPQPAAAAPPPPAKKAVNEFLAGGADSMRLMRDMLRGTEKIVQGFLEYPSTTQIPLSDLRTNPFRASAVKPDGEAADRKRREEERQLVLKAVGGLQLQSILAGARKSCMINNTLYQEGQQVGQFTIEKISPSAVIIKSGAYRFELKMQQ